MPSPCLDCCDCHHRHCHHHRDGHQWAPPLRLPPTPCWCHLHCDGPQHCICNHHHCHHNGHARWGCSGSTYMGSGWDKRGSQAGFPLGGPSSADVGVTGPGKGATVLSPTAPRGPQLQMGLQGGPCFITLGCCSQWGAGGHLGVPQEPPPPQPWGWVKAGAQRHLSAPPVLGSPCPGFDLWS